MKDNISSFTLSASSAIPDIMTTLRKYGLVVMPAWLKPADVEQLREEQELIYQLEGPGIQRLDYTRGRFVRLLRNEMERQKLPKTFEVFSSDFMNRISREYIGADYEFNREIFVSDDQPDSDPIVPVHFDRLWMLKFYIYLADTTAEDGAFAAVPGSHVLGKSIHSHYVKRGVRLEDIPNKLAPVDLPQPVSIEGTAGSLIIFETNVYHMGGVVQPGHRRLVMRGHTRKLPLEHFEPKKYSRQWWKEAWFNPVSAAYRLYDRITGNRMPQYKDYHVSQNEL